MKTSKFQIDDCPELTFMTFSGSAKIGKSYSINAVCEITGLYHDDKIGKLDIDEKNDRDFQRFHPSVLAMQMRDFDDIARITSQLPKGCRLVLCDTPGAFQTFASKITERQDFLVESNIAFVPVIVTLDQGEAGLLVQTWLEIFQHCKKAFVIQNVIKDPCGLAVPPLILPEGIPQPAEIVIMQMPYLHAPFANEMSRIAARIMQVIDCDIEADESEILAMSQTRRFVSAWAIQAESALAPLTEFITRITEDTTSPENAKTATKKPKPVAP